MKTDLLPIPPIPPGLRENASIGRVIPFIGAGASRLAGCPSWGDFADRALRQLVTKGKFTCAELDQVKHLSPRVKLSIAQTLAGDTKTPIDFEAILHPTPSAKHANGQRLYRNLFALGNVFVTTNYDRWLDERISEPLPGAAPVESPSTPPAAMRMRSIYKVSQFLPSVLEQANTVVHLHGSVAEPGSMVLTTRDYINRYANDHRTGDASLENRTLTFLEHLFGNYTVFFIGYGLEELEILEYVIHKAKPRATAAHTEVRHFLLQGFFSHETVLKSRMETYYQRECGIQLVPFLRDKRGHEQLLEVLDDLSQRMPASTPLVLRQVQMLEGFAREMEPLP